MTLKSRAAAVVSLISISLATTSAFQTKRPASLLLDRAYMNDVRARGEKGDATIKAAIATLEADAKKALAIEPMSVMDKTITPPSGNKHDYMSQAPYWWPDPSKPDGKPYIRKDGIRSLHSARARFTGSCAAARLHGKNRDTRRWPTGSAAAARG